MGTKRRVCRGAKRQGNVAPVQVEPVERALRETFVLVWCGVGWGGVGSFPGEASILMGRDGDMDGDDGADAAARVVGARPIDRRAVANLKWKETRGC